jgi:hypothetical protein
MSRLEEECIAYIGRNRSGIDAGQIDYGIFTDKFDRMSEGCLNDALRSLEVIRKRIEERLEQLKTDKNSQL